MNSLLNKFIAKSLLAGLAILCISSSLKALAGKVLNKRQARHYVEHVIDTLVIPAMHSGSYSQELESFNEETATSLSNLGYTADQLYPATLKELASYIKHKSLHYARKEIKNRSLTHATSENKITQAVAQKIADEVQHIIDRSSLLEAGVFSSYVGAPLRTKVISLVDRELKAIQPTSKKKHKRTHGCRYHHNDTSDNYLVSPPFIAEKYVYQPTSATHIPTTSVIYQPTIRSTVVEQPVIAYTVPTYAKPTYTSHVCSAPVYEFYDTQPKSWFGLNFNFSL